MAEAAMRALPDNPTFKDIRVAARRFTDEDPILYKHVVEILLQDHEHLLHALQQSTGGIQPIDWMMLADRERSAQWLIEPVLPKGRLVALYAAGKAGKSLLSLDMALALATGREILKRPAGPPEAVLYIDQEMTEDDLEERLDDLGYDPATDDLTNLIYYQLQAFEPFDTPEGAGQLIQLVEEHKPSLLVFDTVARLVEGAENDADTYRNMYRESLQHLKALGITVLRLDHAGKKVGKGQRGSSAKNDDVDVVWLLEANSNSSSVRLVNERQRISWAPPFVELRREHGRHSMQHPWATSPAVAECVRNLDSIGAPLDISVRGAKELLKANGHSGQGTDTRMEAISYRKRTESLKVDPPPDVPKTASEHSQIEGPSNGEEHKEEHSSKEPRNTDADGTIAFLNNERNATGTPPDARSSLPAPLPRGAEETRDLDKAEQNLRDADLLKSEDE
jgi:hypothetical protein